MRDYGRVTGRFWTGRTGKLIRSLPADTRSDTFVVALYLVTCPSSNMIGLYYLPLPTLCHETGLTTEGASKALRSLKKLDFAYYDEADEIVWVPNMAREQIGDVLEPKDNRHKGVLREMEQYKRTRLFAEFHGRYQAPFNLPEARPFEAPSKPLRSQEQEQEQEQDQEQEDPAESFDSSARSDPPGEEAPKPRLPFRALHALSLISAASGGRFVAPRRLGRGHSISLENAIRAYPDEATFTTFGAWIAAGGGWRNCSVSYVVSQFENDVESALAWNSRGRGPVNQPGQTTRRGPDRAMSDESAAAIDELFAPRRG